jgi:hypothetical protein
MKILHKLSGVLVCAALMVPVGHSHASEKQELDSHIRIKAQPQQSSLAVIQSLTYRYKATTFGYNVYLGGGQYYYNPKDITINPSRSVKNMSIALIKSDGTSRKMNLGSFSGGIHVPLGSLRSGDGKYKVKLINETNGASSISLNAGTLWYN